MHTSDSLFSRLYARFPKWIRHALYHSFLPKDFSPADFDDQYKKYWLKKTGGDLSIIPPPQAYKASLVIANLSPGDTVIDIGCGNGAVIREIRRKLKNVRLIGADISPDCLNYLRGEGLETITHDVVAPNTKPDLPETDWALLFEVLEHIPNPENYLLNTWIRVRKGIFFSVPNSGYFPYRLRLLFGSFPIQWHVHPGEHLRFWTYRDLKRWLRNLGLEGSYQISFHNGVPGLSHIWGSLFGMGLIVRISKNPNERPVGEQAPNPSGDGSVLG